MFDSSQMYIHSGSSAAMSGDSLTSTAALRIESLVKEGKSEQAGQELGKEFQSMKPGEFRSLLANLKAENDKDRASDRSLPGLQIYQFESSTEVDVTSSSLKYGNLWRDEKAVFVDVESSYKTQDPFRTGSGETVIAGNNSFVIASGDGHVVALGGSRVIAKDNVDVVAKDHSLVDGHDHAKVTAEKGSNVGALDNAEVDARGYSTVQACDTSMVTARNHSSVEALGASTVIAKAGSTVEGYERSKIIAEPNSNVTVSGDASISRVTGAK